MHINTILFFFQSIEYLHHKVCVISQEVGLKVSVKGINY